ncbi:MULTISPECIES: chitinase [unclassified Kitasatospora]|uniref:chitinase n=1 Tax=unclassified Kitasatospora TaxID=2633591 RepID=UPI00070E3D07|nr:MULTISPECIES: glycosyl hydrolase family 18 protein [unclassified Kitasatospora]KQV11781.1 chitinase [Kitasatospora sp. Root107]KRB76638.1 chitinase [Kitasatospora sp. Root187]
MRTPRTTRRVVAAATAWSTAAAGAVALSFTLAPTASAGEFLGNGGFETGSVSPWSCTGGLGSVTSQARTGSYALAGAASASDSAKCSQTVTVKPSTTYQLTGWVKGAYVYLGVDGGTSTWTPGTGGAFQKLSVSFTTTASQTSATVYTHGWYGQGTYYADDLSLDGPGAPSPSPSGTVVTDPPSPSVSASVSASPSPSTSQSPTAPPNGLPAHALVGYLHASFANGAGYTKVADIPDSWDVINLSFGEPTSVTSGDIRFNRCPATECAGVESDADFKAAIAAKQAKGKKVLISIGGQNGQVQLTTTAARDTFVSSVSAIIDKWGLNGLDIDFEGHSLSLNTGDTDFKNPTSPVVVNLISALKTLKAKYGQNFVLTMAPETFFVQLGYQYYGSGPWGGQDPRAGAYLPVIYAMRGDLTLLHVQDYNSGSIMGLDNQYHSMGGADFHVAMTDMLLKGFPVAGNIANMFPPLAASQLAIGMPATVNAGNGYVSPTEVDKALDCLTKLTNCGTYVPRSGAQPNLRGLMTWSINWDQYNGVREFSKNFDSYFG